MSVHKLVETLKASRFGVATLLIIAYLPFRPEGMILTESDGGPLFTTLSQVAALTIAIMTCWVAMFMIRLNLRWNSSSCAPKYDALLPVTNRHLLLYALPTLPLQVAHFTQDVESTSLIGYLVGEPSNLALIGSVLARLVASLAIARTCLWGFREIERALVPRVQGSLENLRGASGSLKSGLNIAAAHCSAVLLVIASMALYLMTGLVRFTLADPTIDGIIPGIYPLLVFLMLSCTLFSVAACLLDRFHIPFASILIAVLVFAPAQKHELVTTRADQSRFSPSEITGHYGFPSAVIVSAEGGGSRAAAWTARVLLGIGEELRKDSEIGIWLRTERDFPQRVIAISGVSGGAVGAMFAAAHYPMQWITRKNNIEQPFKTAADPGNNMLAGTMRSGQEAIAWGLSYPSILRRVFGSKVRSSSFDTGGMLEASWLRDCPGCDETLSTWSLDAEARRKPVVLFTATDILTSEPFFFCSCDLGKRRALDPGTDIRVVSAARASSTFPVVTSASEVHDGATRRFLIDGGYSDNFGTAGLRMFAEAAFPVGQVGPTKVHRGNSPNFPDVATGQNQPIKRLLIIRIETSKRSTQGSPPSKLIPQVIPLATFMEAHWDRQAQEADAQIGALKQTLEEQGIFVEEVILRFEGDDYLTWGMSHEQKMEIEKEWDRIVGNIDPHTGERKTLLERNPTNGWVDASDEWNRVVAFFQTEMYLFRAKEKFNSGENDASDFFRLARAYSDGHGVRRDPYCGKKLLDEAAALTKRDSVLMVKINEFRARAMQVVTPPSGQRQERCF